MFRGKKGFSLIELMITVAILAILATVGYPLYTKHTLKAHRAEARTALMRLAMAQERFFTRNNRYYGVAAIGDTPGNLEPLYHSSTTYAALTAYPSPFNGHSEGRDTEYKYDITIDSATTTSFVLRAVPTTGRSQEKDSDCTSFTIDNLGVKTGSKDICW